MPSSHGVPRGRLLLAALALVLVAGGLVWWRLGAAHPGSHPSAGPPTVTPAPGMSVPTGPVSLTGWKLSVPVVGKDGDATTIDPAAPSAPFLSRSSDGALVFWAPTHGTTTKHSLHPRTELDSLSVFAGGQGRHTLTAWVTLQQEPGDGRGVILGQIHGANEISSVPYVMLRYQQGKVRVVVKQVQDGDDLINYPLLDGVRVGDTFQYTITDQGDGTMVFDGVKDGMRHHVVAPVPAAFAGATVRFQAGDYQQADTPGGPTDGARVTFHALSQQP